MRGIVRIPGSGQRIPPARYASTRFGPQSAGSTVPMETGIWCAAARLSRRMHSWRLWIDDTPRPGWTNMAIDQTLLEHAEQSDESWLRLYQWSPHCLSFGRHEPAALRYNRTRIEALGIDAVRRPSGGRAVWHAQELTYAVAARSEHFGSLR